MLYSVLACSIISAANRVLVGPLPSPYCTRQRRTVAPVPVRRSPGSPSPQTCRSVGARAELSVRAEPGQRARTSVGCCLFLSLHRGYAMPDRPLTSHIISIQRYVPFEACPLTERGGWIFSSSGCASVRDAEIILGKPSHLPASSTTNRPRYTIALSPTPTPIPPPHSSLLSPWLLFPR